MVEDITGKPLPAITVFSRAIQFMKEDFLLQFKSKIDGQMEDRDICWVLTVPAIWNESAKQFMRHAAVTAGVKNQHLRIALEPEAASLLCNYLPVKKFTTSRSQSMLQTFQKGSKYMVLDAGGGTVDITVHETMGGGKLKELYKASGGPWGGTTVDEAFKQFIIQLVGFSVFQKFSTECTDDLLDMFRGFEVKKREIQSKKESMITFRIPVSLLTLFEDEIGETLQQFVSESSVFSHQVKIVHGKIKVDAEIFKDFFRKPVHNITSFVRTLLQQHQLKGVKSIIMVGGFSECQMLQESIMSNFPEISIIIPQEPGSVVLKGAVIYGHNQGAIVERVCRYTYGIAGAKPFKKGLHREEFLEESDVGPLCSGVLIKVAEAGQSVKLNERQEAGIFKLNMEDQDTYSFPIYVSNQASPMYITDVGCEQVGCVSLSGLDISIPLEDRKVAVSVIFGGTEIEVEAREIHTGLKSNAILDFLQ
ncbi:hypothetical protein CHS0354_007570 [Potamilus streckersoni]|uniref:Heat shock 70 kDa protein 12A n=1 Tax=Potamilus streckersoni TaxID=2493646 RepID=A0AAE0W7N3_9BIVA|nr:hypothetical protein CHS0354_007570 [Potamilus streckersoni]